MTILSKNGWSLEQTAAKSFTITNLATSKTYSISSTLFPDGIDLSDVDTRHFYVTINGGVTTTFLGGSAGFDILKNNLWENPAPVGWWDLVQGSDVETTGSTTNTLGPGSVTHLRDDVNDEYIVNITNDDGHPLDPGAVVRIPIEDDSRVYIVSIGFGNGPNPELNQDIANPIWSHNTNNIIDETFFESIFNRSNYHIRDYRSHASDDLPGYIEEIRSDFQLSTQTVSPLILDLTGTGIDLVSYDSDGAVYWNHRLDGFAYASGWVGPDMGILATDLNSDGMINDSSELFGNADGFDNGFLALAFYDSNLDGIITAEDQIWDSLIVWVDENQDGFSQTAEMNSLDSLLISQINLSYTEVDYAVSGNKIYQEGTFVINGNTRDIVDAYFTHDTINSVSDIRIEPDYEVFSLPLHRGYGTLPDFHIAMSLDNEGAGNLLNLVSGFNDQTIDEIFDSLTTMDSVRDIMYRWAGVDGVSPTSRGWYVDAQELEFLEALTGQGFLQRGGTPNPYWDAAALLEEGCGSWRRVRGVRCWTGIGIMISPVMRLSA